MSVSESPDTQCPDEQKSIGTISVARSASLSTDETRKHIQKQLVLLLHAHICQRLENQSDGEARRCSLPFCQIMKGLLSHMAICQAGKFCDVPHCASSHTIITHWNNCTLSDCPVCSPIKQTFNSRQQQAADVQSSPVPAPTNVQQTNELLKFPLNAGNNSANINPGMQPSQTVSVSQEEIPDNPTTSKDWRQSVTVDFRHHLVQKMVQEIFPRINASTLLDRRMVTLVQYACKIEECMFAAANSKEEYFHLIAGKICVIQKELKEKRRKEMEKRQQVDSTLGPIFSNTSSSTTSKVLPCWSPGPSHPSPPSFVTVPPNTSRVSGLFSSPGSQLSNSINANIGKSTYQSEFHPAQAQQSLPSPVGLQHQLLPQALPTSLTTTSSASVDSSATPATLNGIPVFQFKSSPLQNHSHMSDASETGQIAFELIKEDGEDSSESAGSLFSEDDESGISSS
ncbi:unnamed protein product [Larinioides sclopetarius]|uniref:histone acetyltransferase n=1 Tax=Larinioides sclopetarius TaxID=280406 RepID=A0AAV2BD89_9ARAC